MAAVAFDVVRPETAVEKKPAQKGFWAAFLDAMMESRRQQADREIERLKAIHPDLFNPSR